MRSEREYASKRKILLSTVEVVVATIIIKFLGLIKQSVLAAYCGATAESDAFFLATGTLVSLCSVVFSSISISLLSIHTDVLVNQGREKSNELINASLRVFIPVAIILSLLSYVFAPYLAKFIAPAYNADELFLLTRYVRMMSISFVFWCYYLTVNVALKTDKIFLPGRGQGFFLNVFLILGTIFLYGRYEMGVLVYAFLFSGLAECILVTWCARKKFRIIFRRIASYDVVKHIVEVAVPLFLGNAIYEINSIVDGQISTSIGAGSASILTYGATIHDMVVGVVVNSVSTVLFSHFSTWIAEGDLKKVETGLRDVLEYLTMLLLPIMIMCIVAGDQLVEIFYGRGNFGAAEIQRTYGVVIGYSFGFIFQAARSNLVKVYYAFQDSKRPMINGLISVSCNIVISITLSRFIGIAGVAAGTSCAMLIVTSLLLAGVKKYLPNFKLKDSLTEVGKGIIASAITCALLILLKRFIDFNVWAEFILEGVIVVVVHCLLLMVFKSDSMKALMTKWRSRIRR